MNNVRVLLFATLRDRAGAKELTLQLAEGATVRSLKDVLKNAHPSLGPALGSVLVSINREYADDEDPIPQGCEVALFPPVSGG